MKHEPSVSTEMTFPFPEYWGLFSVCLKDGETARILVEGTDYTWTDNGRITFLQPVDMTKIFFSPK